MLVCELSFALSPGYTKGNFILFIPYSLPGQLKVHHMAQINAAPYSFLFWYSFICLAQFFSRARALSLLHMNDLIYIFSLTYAFTFSPRFLYPSPGRRNDCRRDCNESSRGQKRNVPMSNIFSKKIAFP